jgi:tetratricopeptide (TPR) repeat protein
MLMSLFPFARRTRFVLLSAAAIVTLVGCSRDEEPAPAPKPVAEPAPERVPEPVPEPTPEPAPVPPQPQPVTSAPADIPDIMVADISEMEPVIQEQINAALERVRANPEDAAANGHVAMLYQTYDLLDEAVPMYERAAAFEPTNARWPYLMHDCLVGRGKVEPALAALRRTVEIDPDYVNAWAAMGYGLIDVERYDDACQAFERARAIAPDAATVQYGLGRAHLLAGRPDKAIEPLRQAVAISRQCGVFHRELAKALDGVGHTAAAANERILGCSPGEVPQLDDRARRELSTWRVGSDEEVAKAEQALIMRDSVTAMAHLDKALEYAPRSVRAHLARASLLFHLDRGDEAVAACRVAVETIPDSPEALCVLADAITKVQKSQDVGDLYDRALAIDPDRGPVLLHSAKYLASIGDLETAEARMRKAIEVSPDILAARTGLVDLLIGQKKQDDAFAETQRIVEQWPAHGPSHQLLAMMYADRGDHDAAILHHRCAIEASPLNPTSYLLLSQEYEARQQYGMVERTLTRGLEQVPDSADMRNALAWLRATCPDALYRNGQEAVRITRALCEDTGYKNVSYVDTLAAAHAEVAEFAIAIELQQQVIDAMRAANRKPPPGWLERLNLYKARKPYRGVSKMQSRRASP